MPTPAASWPPDMGALKLDLSIEDDSDDMSLRAQLAAAVAYVQRVHAARYDFTEDASGELPAPDADMVLGTIRLAGRWFNRRRSPDGLVAAGEFGTSRIPSVDGDLERMLRIGRWAPSVIA
jgi:hypothetical protein